MMLNKFIVFVIILFVCGVFAGNYTPLTRADKKEFVKAVKAINMAIEAKNYVGVMRFGAGILEKYESILLDPGSEKLRPDYEAVAQLLSEIGRLHAVDTFEVRVAKLTESQDCWGLMSYLDGYFDYLTEQKNDSMVKVHTPIYNECIVKSFDGEFESLRKLSEYKYAKQQKVILDSLARILEFSFKELFFQVSSSNNIEELFAFKKAYPGLYTDDVNNLIANYKAKMKLGIKRKPSLDRIEEYYLIFPESNRLVDSIYQKVLYDGFRKELNMTSAMKYLSNFPNGKNASEIRTFIDVQQEQARINSIQGYQAQNTNSDDVGNGQGDSSDRSGAAVRQR